MSYAALMSPPTELSPAEMEALGDEIAASAAHLNAALGRWLGLVGTFDACGGWAGWGVKSCAEWLAWRCSLSPVTAREHVRVARRLSDLPLVAAALRRGELSYSKVRAIVRLEHVSDEEHLLELARHASASQLERIIRVTRRVTRAEAAAAVEDRHVDVRFEDDGTAVIKARVPAEDGALLLRALGHVDALLAAGDVGPDEVGESSTAGDGAQTPESPARWVSPARRADALAWMADRALLATAEDATPRMAGEPWEVLVHVDAGLLTGDADPAAEDPDEAPGRTRPCHLDDGAPLAAETVRRLCCDAGIVPVVRDGDRTLAVGRRTRSIPPAIRRALRVRRPCCAFPGCGRTRWLDAHHVVHWAHGGRTDLDNLVQLCRHHHRLMHEGGWVIAVDRDGRCEVRAPDGRALVNAPAPPTVGALAWAGRGGPAAAGAERALTPLSSGQRYDLGLAVDAVMAWTQAPDPVGGCAGRADHPLAA